MNARGMRNARDTGLEPLVELRAVVMRADPERLGHYDAHRVRRRLRDAYDPIRARFIEADGAPSGPAALAAFGLALRAAPADRPAQSPLALTMSNGRITRRG